MTWFPPEAVVGRGYPTIDRPIIRPVPTVDSGSKLIAALEKVWVRIQHFNPDTPDVVIITGGGRMLMGLVLGHFAESSWSLDVGDADRRHELFVGGEGLARGARDVLGTMLHEASHGIAATRKIQDTSRQGRYHNGEFKSIAEEVGIEVSRDPTIGWSLTTLPDRTAALYAEQVIELAEAIRLHRRDPLGSWLTGGSKGGAGWGDKVKTPTGKTPKQPAAPVYECGCDKPRRVRMSRTDFNAGPLHCGICNEDFGERDELNQTAA